MRSCIERRWRAFTASHLVESVKGGTMKTLLMIVIMLASTSGVATAQSGDTPAKSAAEVAKSSSQAKKRNRGKKISLSQEAASQKASTPGRALVDNPIDKNAKPSDPIIRSGDKKKDFAAQEAESQKLSTPGRALVDNPINKNAKPATPKKSKIR
jgi:hypothetical protein